MQKFSVLKKINNVHADINKLINYFDDIKDVSFAYLFGGIARNRISAVSDYDIAVFMKDKKRDGKLYMKILKDLMDILKTDEIDLVVLPHFSIHLMKNIITNKIVINDKEHFERLKFESLVLRMYFDFQYRLEYILDRKLANG